MDSTRNIMVLSDPFVVKYVATAARMLKEGAINSHDECWGNISNLSTIVLLGYRIRLDLKTHTRIKCGRLIINKMLP